MIPRGNGPRLVHSVFIQTLAGDSRAHDLRQPVVVRREHLKLASTSLRSISDEGSRRTGPILRFRSSGPMPSSFIVSAMCSA